MKIKICGVMRECDIDYVNYAQPEYVGFVFAPSRRRISVESAAVFKSKLIPHISAVGVFVDEDIDFINRLVHDKIIDIVQLHGRESDDYIQRINAPTIKAVRIGEDINRPSEFLLFDGVKAGSGESFDWSKLPETDKPFFIAGGININNINQAMALNPYGIDISSGVETDGFKDKQKIIEIVRRVRNG